jgi:hypothetical protein
VVKKVKQLAHKGGQPMPFLEANIDRAIVMTQYDLRGFGDPLGFRIGKGESAKCLDQTTGNFLAVAVGLGHKEESKPTDGAYIGDFYFTSSFEDYLAMCNRLALACGPSQKEAIQLIVQEIVDQSKEMKAKVAAGKMRRSSYLQPLEKGNRWGKAVLALSEAFGVILDQACLN